MTLKPSERQAAEKLVNNDYANLTNQIRQHANEVIEQRQKEVQEEFAAKTEQAKAFEQRVREFRRRTEDDWRGLKEMATANGVTIHGELNECFGRYANETVRVNIVGLDNAIRDATKAVHSALARAENAVETQRLASQRKVLQAALSEDALEIVNGLPQPEEVLAQFLTPPKELASSTPTRKE